MALSVSIANSIRFRPVDTELWNFDNTFINSRHNRFNPEGFCQILPPSTYRIQAQSATGDAVTCRQWYNNAWSNIAADSVVTLDTFDFTEFILSTVGLSGPILYELTDGTTIWRSHSLSIDTATDDHLVLEWFNHENAFLMNYLSGIVPLMVINASLVMGQPSGDVTVYENQGTQTNLKEIVKRVMQFEAYVPDYIAEQLTIAMAHDRFFINDIEYVKEKKPNIEPIGQTNIYKFTAELTQKTAIGLNTHDVGFDVDGGIITTDIMNLQILGASVNHTLEIPAGYMLHSITAIWKEGTNVTLKAGTIALSDDIMESISLSAASANNLVAIHQDNPTVSTIFFTLTADAAPVPQIDIHVQLIKNRV